MRRWPKAQRLEAFVQAVQANGAEDRAVSVMGMALREDSVSCFGQN